MDKKIKFAVIATDVIIFTIKDGALQVLLIKINKAPFKDFWAVPGGLIKPAEDLKSAAKRHLLVKTGFKNIYLEQLYTFGEIDRDPLGRVVSVAYFALIPYSRQELMSSANYSEVTWSPVDKLPRLAHDHKQMVETAVARLRAKLEYTNAAYSLLPEEFTLTELQSTYEIILNKKIDKRNFRKKILSNNLLRKTNRQTSGEAHRPASLYSFISHKPQIAKIL